MMTAGVGGAITGRGGNLLICDDPVKNSKDAQSPTVRASQWMWYKSTFRTRLQPDGVILVIGTRWHEDDLIGRIINEMRDDPTADQFIIVRLPAIWEGESEDYPEPDPLGREIGEALFPEMWDVKRLIPYQSNAYTWSALYQQRPSPAEGGLFQEDWFEVGAGPRDSDIKRVIRRWDLAATDPKKGEDPDWTVGVKMCETKDGDFYVLDMVRVQQTPGSLSRTLRVTTERDGFKCKVRMEQEPGSSGKISVWHLARGPFRGYAFKAIRSTGNKILRAETVADAVERRDIKLKRGPWNRDFLREVCRFPNDAHDDIVDAFSGAYEDLTKRANRLVTY
jgi:predicted phage terminase large subunit-like protein